MVNLGYMLPTDEEHDMRINEISNHYEMTVQEIINLLIDKAYKNGVF